MINKHVANICEANSYVKHYEEFKFGNYVIFLILHNQLATLHIEVININVHLQIIEVRKNIGYIPLKIMFIYPNKNINIGLFSEIRAPESRCIFFFEILIYCDSHVMYQSKGL